MNAQAAVDDRCARVGGYYLGRHHGLIHRHREAITIDPSQSARWELAIDFQLPTDPAARTGGNDDDARFLFPLLFKKKAEGRTKLFAKDENSKSITLPTRRRCDETSALAATETALEIASRCDEKALPREDLEALFKAIATGKPYKAFVVLNELLHLFGGKLVEAWRAAGLVDCLEMLVEHTLVWVPLRGRPGELRTIEIGHDTELARPPFLRWNIVELEPRWWRRSKRLEDPKRTLDTGAELYGRCGYRFSFAVAGEALVRPFALIPIEFDFPTIYTRRCTTYHFELRCPNGLTPRALKIALDDGSSKRREIDGRRTTHGGVTHAYLPGDQLGDLLFRATVGIGHSAFPVLWFLMGAVTSLMLWILAADNPTHLVTPTGRWEGKDEIAAGILLVVPALLGATVIGAEQGQRTRLLGGARLLLLTAGLSSVAAAVALLATSPLGVESRGQWTACATIATLVTIPLGTSWLLSHPPVWKQLARLNNRSRQYLAFAVLVAAAIAIVWGLGEIPDDDGPARSVLAVALLLVPVPLILLASSRFAVPMNEPRRFLSIGVLVAALACTLTGCVELRAAFDHEANFREEVERVVPALLFASIVIGWLVSLFTRPFGQKSHSVHLSPRQGRELVAGKRIRELRRLRDRQQDRERRD